MTVRIILQILSCSVLLSGVMILNTFATPTSFAKIPTPLRTCGRDGTCRTRWWSSSSSKYKYQFQPSSFNNYNYNNINDHSKENKKTVAIESTTSAAETSMEGSSVDSSSKLRSDFINVLRSRRNEVPLAVEVAEPVKECLFQETPRPLRSEAMESCPRESFEKDQMREENLYLITEGGEQGRLPVLILSLKESKQQKRPAIVFLHSTHKCKEWVRPLLEAYASRGYIAVAIDSRYHGERASNLTTYRDALVQSWKTGGTMPFIFDTVWDLIKLADYLSQREDIDPSRIGITGESLGGMHASFAAFVDTRYSVVVPIIGVQGFQWAIENNKWQARVDSIKAVFEEARVDLGKNEIDKEVVQEVWDRIAPGLASQFDAPYTVPPISPRPLLILNGAEDPRCPIAGLEVPISSAREAYKEANCPENFKVIAEPECGHKMTSQMVKEASDWFDKFFLNNLE